MELMKGELVRLAQIERENLPAFKRWFRDYEVQRFLMRIAAPITDEAEEEWYEAAARRVRSRGGSRDGWNPIGERDGAVCPS